MTEKCHYCGSDRETGAWEYIGTCWKCEGDGRPRKNVLGKWVPDPGAFDSTETCDICGGAGNGIFFGRGLPQRRTQPMKRSA